MAFGRESESADVGIRRAPDIGAALFQHGEPPAIEAEDGTGHPHAPNPAADHETRGRSRSLTIWEERCEKRSYHGHFPFSAFVTPCRIFVRFNALFLHRMVVSTKMAAFQQVNGPANLEVVLC